MKKDFPQCAFCAIPAKQRICRTQTGNGPEFCPTLRNRGLIDRSLKKLEDPALLRFAQNASIQEAECYANRDKEPFVLLAVKPRLQEIIEFAGRMGYRRLGLAFCDGLSEEARTTALILSRSGFEVVSVRCCVGGISKEAIGLREDQKIHSHRYEPMCNPVAQAELCNDAGTELNILLGLCVGHDSLFIKHSKAYTTVFAVKDRLLGHNPLALVYTAGCYYRRFLE